MNILLVAGGDPKLWPADIMVKPFDLFVGIDRGALFLLEENKEVALAVGDFDSLSKKEHDLVGQKAQEILSAIAEKDDTDTQLALASIFAKYPLAQVTLIGATGGRLDHLLANIWLGVEPRFTPFMQQITIRDNKNCLSYLPAGKHRVKKIPGLKYLAYCCLTPVSKLTLTKSKYTLDQVEVLQPTSYASNEFIGQEAEISFASGIVAVIQSRD